MCVWRESWSTREVWFSLRQDCDHVVFPEGATMNTDWSCLPTLRLSADCTVLHAHPSVISVCSYRSLASFQVNLVPRLSILICSWFSRAYPSYIMSWMVKKMHVNMCVKRRSLCQSWHPSSYTCVGVDYWEWKIVPLHYFNTRALNWIQVNYRWPCPTTKNLTKYTELLSSKPVDKVWITPYVDRLLQIILELILSYHNIW
jgi:hypothetical protein